MHHSSVSNDFLLQQLHWRYATKKFDPSRKIAEAEWKTLEQALVLTPSAYGVQPWKFLVIENPDLRRALVPATKNQPQVVDASHYVVFAIKAGLSVADIDAHVARIIALRGVAPESTAGFRQVMVGRLVEGMTREQVDDWAKRQIYLALGNFLTCAALMGIDTCPIEGCDPIKYDEILGLPARGLATAVACAAGFRSSEDPNATLAKVRFDAAYVIEHLL